MGTLQIGWDEARNYTRVSGKREIDLIVIHDMEWPERPTTAEDCARMFATTTRSASAHYNVDNNSIVQGVKDNDVAWAAPGANHNGIQIEQAGHASQDRAEWLDAYGRAMIFGQVAPLVEMLAAKYRIPLSYRNHVQIAAGLRGITTHWDVSKAWGRTDHTDPGRNYPMSDMLDEARSIRKAKSKQPPKPTSEKSTPPTLRYLDHINNEVWRVKQAQRLLNYAERVHLGDDKADLLAVDGVYGPAMMHAVERFKREGLGRTGSRADGKILGAEMWKALWAARYTHWEAVDAG